MTEDLTKKAMARLAVTERKCDGCATYIGRWTSACYYDPTFDRAYCSTNGCAVKFTRSPFCSSCGAQVNPFETKGVTRIPVAGGEMTYCAVCSSDDSLEAAPTPKEPPKTRGGKKRSAEDLKLNIPQPVIVVHDDSPPTEAEVRDCEQGPYKLVQPRPGHYQVVRPLPGGKQFVRSTGSNPNRLTKKCAEFNRAE